MVATTDQTQSDLQARYEQAGVSQMIAERAAVLSQKQESGEPLDVVEQQILDFANRGMEQQGELQALNEYGQSLDDNGFEVAGPDYRDRISDLGQNYEQHQGRAAAGIENEWVDDRRVGLAASLSQSGFQPQTSPDIQDRAQQAIAVGQIPGLTPEEESQRAATQAVPAREPEELALEQTDVTQELALRSDGVQDVDSADTRTDALLEQAGKILSTAREAGLTQRRDGMDVVQGENGLTIAGEGDTLIISGEGRQFVGVGDRVVKDEGITDSDRQNIANAAQMDATELLQKTEQRQLQIQKQREGQREPAQERSPNMQL